MVLASLLTKAAFHYSFLPNKSDISEIKNKVQLQFAAVKRISRTSRTVSSGETSL